jgi:hypothetical protein
MGFGQRGCYLGTARHCRRPGNSAAEQCARQRAALDKLHDEIRSTILAVVEDTRDVGMAGSGERLGLTAYARLIRLGHVENLDGNRAAQAFVVRTPDFGCPTVGQPFNEAVAPIQDTLVEVILGWAG